MSPINHTWAPQDTRSYIRILRLIPFARARNVEWRGGMPVITESQDPYNTGFKGFLSSEELVRLIQHADVLLEQTCAKADDR